MCDINTVLLKRNRTLHNSSWEPGQLHSD